MSNMGSAEMTQLLIDRIQHTKSNRDLIGVILKSKFAENLRSWQNSETE